MQGRPRKRWVDDILKWCDMTLQQALHHAQDRATWRNLIAGPYGSWTTGQEEEEEVKESPHQAYAQPGILCGHPFSPQPTRGFAERDNAPLWGSGAQPRSKTSFSAFRAWRTHL